MNWIDQLFTQVTSSLWRGFTLIQAHTPESGSTFGLGEYLASLALFMVILTTSDFRYAYRLSLTKTNFRTLGFWCGLSIGVGILTTDVWFANGFPVPLFLSNENDIKALLGLVYLLFIFRVIFVAIISPPVFNKANAKQFFDANYHYIHQGNQDRIQIVAEEVRRSIARIIALAAKVESQHEAKVPKENGFAHDFLLLVADERFCRVVVDRAPAFALAYFLEAQKHLESPIPIFQFARNIGQEFIRNTNSAFYQEDSGYFSGYVGYVRPITKIIYGSRELVEKCASDGASPLETTYSELLKFDQKQIDGYSRASLAFLECHLKATKGRTYPHSYALARMLDSFQQCLGETHKMDGIEYYSNTRFYFHLKTTVHFIKEAIKLVAQYADKPRTLRLAEIYNGDIYDYFARLIFEVILDASSVCSPVWTCWAIQHNAVWGELFSFDNSAATKIIALKVRRLLYDEIRDMDRFANFKGARILGYCLNVMGLKLRDRHKGYQKEFYPLQAKAISWVKANFRMLLSNHPKVAEACLCGSVTYDTKNHRLIKTYADDTGKAPSQEFLVLD